MRRLRQTLLLLATASLLALPARAQRDAALDPQLDDATAESLRQTLRLGYDDPARAFALLRSLDAQRVPPSWARYIEARLRLFENDDAGARALLPALAAQEPASLLHLRMLLAQRSDNDEAAARYSASSLQAVRVQCPAPLPEGAAERVACPATLYADIAVHAARRELRKGVAEAALATLAAAQVWAQAKQSVDGLATLAIERTEALWLKEQGEAADAALQQALAVAQLPGVWRARLINAQAVLASRREQRELQRLLLQQAVAIAEQEQAPRLAAGLKANLVDALVHQGLPKEGRLLAEQALPVLQRYRDSTAERTLRHNLALALIALREPDAARAQLARLRELRDPTPEAPQQEAAGLREIGQAWAAVGQVKEALAAYHAERRISETQQAQAREAALAEVRERRGSAAQEARVASLQREQSLNAQTLDNQSALRRVTLAAAALVLLLLGVAIAFWWRMRAAHGQLQRKQRLLQELSERDALTGLANRRQFHATMAERGDTPLEGSLLLLDIDHFKRINDERGHAVGDIVIRTLAQRLSAAVRQGDMVARWGGEEFLVYAPHLRGLHAQRWVERVMPQLSQPVPLVPDDPGGERLEVTCSMGYLSLPLPPLGVRLSWERALAWADLALYAAKHRGRRRALGINGLHASDEVSLAQVEADFEGAVSAARISLAQTLA